MMPSPAVVGPEAADIDPDVTLTHAVKALLAWHDLKPVDLERQIGLPKSTAYRRFERGAWELGEVRVLAHFFGLSVDQLASGSFSLAESRLAAEPMRLSREHESAGGEPFSGADIEAICDVAEKFPNSAA